MGHAAGNTAQYCAHHAQRLHSFPDTLSLGLYLRPRGVEPPVGGRTSCPLPPEHPWFPAPPLSPWAQPEVPAVQLPLTHIYQTLQLPCSPMPRFPHTVHTSPSPHLRCRAQPLGQLVAAGQRLHAPLQQHDGAVIVAVADAAPHSLQRVTGSFQYFPCIDFNSRAVLMQFHGKVAMEERTGYML